MSDSYLSTYLVGRQQDRRYQVTINKPGALAERVAGFATVEQARAWVRNQVSGSMQKSAAVAARPRAIEQVAQPDASSCLHRHSR